MRAQQAAAAMSTVLFAQTDEIKFKNVLESGSPSCAAPATQKNDDFLRTASRLLPWLPSLLLCPLHFFVTPSSFLSSNERFWSWWLLSAWRRR
jgi:hypothetical protein